MNGELQHVSEQTSYESEVITLKYIARSLNSIMIARLSIESAKIIVACFAQSDIELRSLAQNSLFP
jgi:hypothetical protein